MKQQFICERRPKADPRNIVLGKNYRITFLTDRLVRFEYNESGAFVDEASQVIWYRDLEEVPFEIKQKNNFLEIQTKSIRIRYDERAFDESILSVKLKNRTMDVIWNGIMAEKRIVIFLELPVRSMKQTAESDWKKEFFPGMDLQY